MCVMRAADGALLDANEAFERLVGASRQDLIGKAFAGAARWLDSRIWERAFQELALGGEVRDVEARMRRADGTVAHVTASFRRVELGRRRCDVAVVRDVTTRREAQVRESAASLYARSLIEASLDPLVTISPEGKISDVNRATEDATGLSRAELIGTDFADYFTEPEKARVGYRRVLAEGYVRDYPLTLRHRSGLSIEVLYNASVYRNERGDLQGVFAAARDVTMRKQMEEALRRSEQSLRSLIEASLDPLVTISPDGKITDVNRATEEATGIARERLVGTDFADYFTEPEKARAGYQQVLARGQVRDYPLTVRHGSGRTIDVLYNASVYRNEAGELQGVFAAARDVTLRRRLEEEVRRHRDQLERLVQERTAELEAAYKELEGFSYSVSHDLRTPLRAIDGFSRVLLEEHREQLDEEGRRLLSVVRESTARMSRLIDEMLAFSRMGRVQMSVADVDMRTLARAVYEELAAAAPARDLRLEVGALPSARGDKVMLRQVLANLLDNAVKFSRSRTPAVIEVGGRTEGGRHLYYVKDNGVGFDMQYAGKLFGVFQRLHAPGEFEGTGIGLALVKRIVVRHGGSVWAEGCPGEGATFHFALPA